MYDVHKHVGTYLIRHLYGLRISTYPIENCVLPLEIDMEYQNGTLAFWCGFNWLVVRISPDEPWVFLFRARCRDRR